MKMNKTNKIKKIAGLVIIGSIIATSTQGLAVLAHETTYQNTVDVKAPNLYLSSLSLNKNEVTPGDTVTVKVRADDEVSGINSITVKYRMPQTKKYMTVELSHTGNNNYEGRIEMTDQMEAGKWQIYSITAKDNAGNTVTRYNSNIETKPGIRNLGAGDFELSGTDEVLFEPVINTDSLHVENLGDTVKISVQGYGIGSGIKTFGIQYKMPNSGRNRIMLLQYNSQTNRYEREIKVNSGMQKGLWTVYSICAIDYNGNRTTVYNSQLSKRLGAQDLKAGNFVIE